VTQGRALLALMLKPYAATGAFVFAWTTILALLAPAIRGQIVPIVLSLSMPAIFQWLILVAQIAYPQSDLTARGSGYREFLLRLPIRTSSLALWPLLATMIGSLVLWFALAYGYFDRVGLTVPIGLVMSIVASATGAIFLISWRPYERGIFRIASIGAALSALIGIGIASLYESSLSVKIVVSAFSLLTVAELVLSIHSVQVARENVSLSPAVRRRRSTAIAQCKRDRPFKSARAAMFWMEWRLRGRVFPMTVLAFGLIVSTPLAFMGGVPAELAGQITVNGWIPLGLPVLIGGTIGISLLMRPDATMTQSNRTAFFLTLPVTNSEILRSKRDEQTVGVVIACTSIFLILCGWLLVPANKNGAVQPLIVLLIKSASVRQIAAVLIVGLLSAGFIWRSRTIWTFAACLNNEARARIVSLASIVLPIVATLPILLIFQNSSNLTQWLPIVPWILAGILIIRYATSFWIYRNIRAHSSSEGVLGRRLVLRGSITVFTLWILFATLLWLQPSDYPKVLEHPVLLIFLGAMMAVPIVRPLLAREYLDIARHG
jgi:hypothetical protein